MWNGIVKDLTYALRSMRRAPIFTLAAVLSLALGIGANTAIFSLIHQVLLKTLPVERPEELVILKSPGPKNGHTYSDEAGGAGSFSYPMFKDLSSRNTVFTGVIARFAFDASIADRGQTDRAQGELVSGNYFDVLGVKPVLGRALNPNDDVAPADSSVAVLGYGFWARHFGQRREVLNQQIMVNGHSMTIVGVAPPDFFGVQLGIRSDLFVPITMKAQMTPNWNGLDDRRDFWLNVLARLKPGIQKEQARAQLQAVYRPLLEDEADQLKLSGDRRARFVEKPIVLEAGAAGRQLLRNDTRRPLLILMAMVGLVLLIACANVANLLVARATARERETSVRLALGASRSRLVRQCLIESLVIALAGGVFGLLAGSWTVSGLLQLMPADSAPRNLSAELDGAVLLFTFGLTIGTGFLFGFLPALESTRTDINSGLKAGTASSSTSRHARIRKLLVVGQISFTLLMMVGTGLFAKTILKLRSVDTGLKTQNVVRFSISPDLNGYTNDQSRSLFQRLQNSLRELPGVSNAGLAQIPLFADSDAGSNVTIEGYAAAPDEEIHLFDNWISPGYFSTLGIPLLAGREFSEADNLQSPSVCIINQATADRYFSGRNPIGYHIAFGSGNRTVPNVEIVGVVKNSKHSKVGEDQMRFIFIPYLQQKNLKRMTFYVSSAMDPVTLMNGLRQKVHNLDPALPVAELKTLDSQIDDSMYQERLMNVLTAAFAGLSVLLAGFGIYGVMSYVVSRRTREIGIRIAVGAPPATVRWLVVREVMIMAAIGVAVGLPLALVLGKAAQSLLYGMTGTDPGVETAAVLSVVLLALGAGYIPAFRATRIDPVTALRNE